MTSADLTWPDHILSARVGKFDKIEIRQEEETVRAVHERPFVRRGSPEPLNMAPIMHPLL